jgi:hypothetical protein
VRKNGLKKTHLIVRTWEVAQKATVLVAAGLGGRVVLTTRVLALAVEPGEAAG